ncbi:MAG TPA: phosphoribosylglycinamide formyltransferase [Longimicrobiales bacterium]|nr:phosphoribosylglycinamide formyltransferase [Longimicrobiales bacterium]
MSVRIAVLASGGGSNLQALLDAFNITDDSPARVALVLSDRDDAGALERARAAGVPAHVVPVRGRAEGEVADETLARLEEHAVGLIALAGYLRLLPAAVVRRYPGRIVNIHPALLPAFGGPGMYGERVHAAVLASGTRVSGPTVHFVNERYDEGAILAQWPVPVLPHDTPATLAARVLAVEHRLYPLVVAALALGSHGVPAPESAAFHLSDDPAPGTAELLHVIRIPDSE